MMHRILLLLTCVALSGCSRGVVGRVDIPRRVEADDVTWWNRAKPAPACARLHDAYGRPSQDATLDTFFRAWEARSRPISPAEKALLGDSTRSLYEVIEAFYASLDSLRSRGEAFNRARIAAVPRFVTLDGRGLYYAVTRDPLNRPSEETSSSRNARALTVRADTLTDFRPNIPRQPSQGLLFVTEAERQILTCFLGTQHSPFGSGSIMSPAIPAKTSRQRADVLARYITVVPGHWGGYWHFETQPSVSSVALRKDLLRAKVYFRLGYQGGEALFFRTPTGWDMVDHRLTWIE